MKQKTTLEARKGKEQCQNIQILWAKHEIPGTNIPAHKYTSVLFM